MNTVLDDNKMLCLANSERIKLNNTMHMLFEVQDLAVASPARVSQYLQTYSVVSFKPSPKSLYIFSSARNVTLDGCLYGSSFLPLNL